MLYQLSYASAILLPLWGRGDPAVKPVFLSISHAITLKRIAHVMAEKRALAIAWCRIS
jgi:hypothetical protein